MCCITIGRAQLIAFAGYHLYEMIFQLPENDPDLDEGGSFPRRRRSGETGTRDCEHAPKPSLLRYWASRAVQIPWPLQSAYPWQMGPEFGLQLPRTVRPGGDIFLL